MKDRRLIVYIIDDDEAMRDSLQQLLDSRGFRAETYSQASDFLDAV